MAMRFRGRASDMHRSSAGPPSEMRQLLSATSISRRGSADKPQVLASGGGRGAPSRCRVLARNRLHSGDKPTLRAGNDLITIDFRWPLVTLWAIAGPQRPQYSRQGRQCFGVIPASQRGHFDSCSVHECVSGAYRNRRFSSLNTDRLNVPTTRRSAR